MQPDRFSKQREAESLEEPVRMAGELARKLGLDPYPVNYWVVDHDEMNQLIAYDGFQRRYPHWRWGMKYDRQQKQDRFGMGKAFEIVNNDDPSNAFLQETNSLADQKAVITHVEAHADFFRGNEWFGLYREGDDGPDAAAMLARHADRIDAIMEDPSVERSEVERFIDAALCLQDTIDQHSPPGDAVTDDPDREETDIRDKLDDLGLSDEVQHQVFDDEWLDARDAAAGDDLAEPRRDVLAFLGQHGKAYDDDQGRAVDREAWQEEVLDIVRREAYYFAPQQLTKVMNEGWAAYWESLMMADEQFAGADELVTYADHQARVLGSPGLNPYSLGKSLWHYVENTANRREVAEHLLRVEGITPRSFHDDLDFGEIAEALDPDPMVDVVTPDALDALDPEDPRVDGEALDRALTDPDEMDVERYPWQVLTYEGLAERHFSLSKPRFRGFLQRIPRSELEHIDRYLFEDDRYASVEEALAAVDYATGWDRMREVRESHNDVTFIDEFLTQEFVSEQGYFAYEYSHAHDDYRATSTDVEDVKKKLLLRFTNFGKPTIAVYDGNFDNRGELLLGHQYNGVSLDVGQAKDVLERTFQLWGRPVNLATIVKEVDEDDARVARRRNQEPEPTETGIRIRYDGEGFEEHALDEALEEELSASEVDYDTKPEDWLA